jgi:GTP cyclohydrolase I
MHYEEEAAIMLARHAGVLLDEHGKDTPRRFLQMLEDLTKCKTCIGECIKWKKFKAEAQDMIVIRDIPFTSVCNHHIVPFMGKAHIAYVPDAYIAGLSKFARVTHHFASQPQVQERLTSQIANYLEDHLNPLGVGVVLEAEHLCMTIRGVQVPGTYTSTQTMRGVFADHAKTAKAEFMGMINHGS